MNQASAVALRARETIPTGDGVTVEATWHEAHGSARGVAVLAPGVAVPARVVHALGDALAAEGWRVVSFDFPGVGASTLHPREVPGGMAKWGTRDLDAVLRRAAEEARVTDGGKLVLVGHSAGAWLIGLTPMAREVDAVLAIASMSGYWRNLKSSSYPQMLPAFFGSIPLVSRALGYIPGWMGLGEDAPGEVLREWAAWCRRPSFLFDRPDLPTYLHELAAPTRVLLPTDDEWATEAAVRGMWDRAGTDVELVTVDPADHGGRIGHIGLLRDRFADTVWADNIAWLNAVTS